jgi:hypothetical protein
MFSFNDRSIVKAEVSFVENKTKGHLLLFEIELKAKLLTVIFIPLGFHYLLLVTNY